ncbi:E3 ubiquitin-protein ligase RNF25 [Armadillidium nasatum]|uniref:E3 ubiquitin-protein ligase RNF25 n=1 Tax=Armadillidium nasatum TaxID=96803 RepID=A0A5N5T1D3_9CRUS|nr:E3 ubiquitin-protein ligase RNF25 [Armadillidium nasatum]
MKWRGRGSMLSSAFLFYGIDNGGYPSSVEAVIKPATAENVEQQHVRVTLIVNLTQSYPDKAPQLELRNPRGIDDDVLKLINVECKTKCEEYLGLPVIYELIELVREKLTANNTPSCPCAICLFLFTDNDHFTKTKCFHYFHSNCLGRYILNCEETAAVEERENQLPAWMAREKRHLLCPVCREPLNEEVNGINLLENPPPEEGELMTAFDPLCPEIKSLQENMKSLYLHQQSKGGIIDLEEEKNKFLISASETIEALNNRENYDEESVKGSVMSENQQEDKHEFPHKPDRQNHSQNIRKGARGRSGSYNQNKKAFSNNYWHTGNKGKYNRRSGKNHSEKLNPSTNDSGLYEDSSSTYVGKNQTKSTNYRYGTEKPDRCNSNFQDNLKVSNCPNHDFEMEENKKMGKRNFYKNFHHKGGGRGNSSSRGGPPPGYSELEKNIRPHATS